MAFSQSCVSSPSWRCQTHSDSQSLAPRGRFLRKWQKHSQHFISLLRDPFLVFGRRLTSAFGQDYALKPGKIFLFLLLSGFYCLRGGKIVTAGAYILFEMCPGSLLVQFLLSFPDPISYLRNNGDVYIAKPRDKRHFFEGKEKILDTKG